MEPTFTVAVTLSEYEGLLFTRLRIAQAAAEARYNSHHAWPSLGALQEQWNDAYKRRSSEEPALWDRYYSAREAAEAEYGQNAGGMTIKQLRAHWQDIYSQLTGGRE